MYDYDSGEYPALYCDAFGCEHVTLRKIRDAFTLTIRGIEFSGGVDELVTQVPQGSPELETFRFRPTSYGGSDTSMYIEYELAGYTLEWDLPISMSVQGNTEMGTLTLRVRGIDVDGIERSLPSTTAILRYSGGTYVATFCEFEGLLRLQEQLPEGDHIRACITCMFSDYGVAGQQIYGDMICFVEIREKYMNVEGKDKYMDLYMYSSETCDVTETYLCPKFELRIPGTGYRG